MGDKKVLLPEDQSVSYVATLAARLGVDVHCLNKASTVFKLMMVLGMMTVGNFQVHGLLKFLHLLLFWRSYDFFSKSSSPSYQMITLLNLATETKNKAMFNLMRKRRKIFRIHRQRQLFTSLEPFQLLGAASFS